MKYIALALLLAGCCPDAVTKTERSERDSVATNLVPKIVYIKGDTVRLYRDTTIYVKDSVFVPIKERLKSKDGKSVVDIDRSNPSEVNATISTKNDSITTLLAENTYWKWIAERTETTVQPDFWDMALSEIVFSGLIALCLILAVVIIARWK